MKKQYVVILIAVLLLLSVLFVGYLCRGQAYTYSSEELTAIFDRVWFHEPDFDPSQSTLTVDFTMAQLLSHITVGKTTHGELVADVGKPHAYAGSGELYMCYFTADKLYVEIHCEPVDGAMTLDEFILDSIDIETIEDKLSSGRK